MSKKFLCTLLVLFSISMNSFAVDLSGDVATTDGTPVCAQVLASGKSMFSCNPTGPFSLKNLPLESDGAIKLQVYADGFMPFAMRTTDFGYQSVVMQRPESRPVDDGLSDSSPLDGSYSALRITYYLNDDYPTIYDSAIPEFGFSGTLNISSNTYNMNITFSANGQPESILASGNIRDDGIEAIFDEFTSRQVTQAILERGGKLTLFSNETGNGDDYAIVWSFKKLSNSSQSASVATTSDHSSSSLREMIDLLRNSAALSEGMRQIDR